jgi:hypothetical protein
VACSCESPGGSGFELGFRSFFYHKKYFPGLIF